MLLYYKNIYFIYFHNFFYPIIPFSILVYCHLPCKTMHQKKSFFLMLSIIYHWKVSAWGTKLADHNTVLKSLLLDASNSQHWRQQYKCIVKSTAFISWTPMMWFLGTKLYVFSSIDLKMMWIIFQRNWKENNPAAYFFPHRSLFWIASITYLKNSWESSCRPNLKFLPMPKM